MTGTSLSVVIAVGLSLAAACDESGTAPGGGVLGGGRAPGTPETATPAAAPGIPATAPPTPATAPGSPATVATTPTASADAGTAVTAGQAVDPDAAAEEATGDEEHAGNRPFAEPGGHFTVAFPSEPTVEERTEKRPIGAVRLKTFTAADGDARLVVAMRTVAARAGKRVDLGRLITQVRDEHLAALRIARKDEHAFETSGLPGLSVSYLGAAGAIEVRGVMHIIARRDPLTVYVAQAMAPPATDEATLRLFVESLEPAATVSGMDEVLARTTAGATDGAIGGAVRTAPRGGVGTYRWSSVRTTGPRACVFFAGPVPRASRRSYAGGSGTWTVAGKRARFQLGGVVDFRGTFKDGEVNVRSVERASLTGNAYTFTETITGDLAADGRFRGTYRYSDCRSDGSERCPGPCTIRATLTGSP